jgi:hypothetical protein
VAEHLPSKCDALSSKPQEYQKRNGARNKSVKRQEETKAMDMREQGKEKERRKEGRKEK